MRLRTCITHLELSHKPNLWFRAIFQQLDSQSGLCEGQLWHEWMRCGCVSGFKSPKIYHHYLRTEIRWFSTYSKHHTQRHIAEFLANIDLCELF